LKGIDIYEGDNIQDWNAVKAAGIEVIIQKASQGTSHIDKLLQYRYPKIKEAGFKVGFYHFASYNSTNPVAEAQYFLNAINSLSSDTVLWLDIEAEEHWDKQTAINYANAFINYVQQQGLKIGIYTGDSFFHDYLEGNIPDVPLWIASYGKQPSLYPDKCSWQYSESGSLSGIVGDVDLNYFQENIIINNDGGMRKVKNLVVYGNDVDRRAAEYLADYLQCPVINCNLPFDYTTVENVYAVGAGSFTSYAKQIIKGADRYATCQAVLDFIGGK
jgi:lysozyme